LAFVVWQWARAFESLMEKLNASTGSYPYLTYIIKGEAGP
jgi:hypothetical protein